MYLGDRIFYDQDGEIIAKSGEMQGSLLSIRKIITDIKYLDMEYGAINQQTHSIVGVNVASGQPILEKLAVNLTPEQQQIKELEDALLLAADAETGGIL